MSGNRVAMNMQGWTLCRAIFPEQTQFALRKRKLGRAAIQADQKLRKNHHIRITRVLQAVKMNADLGGKFRQILRLA
jgi:hypothetical protein